MEFPGVRREAEHFIEGVRTGAPFRSSGEDTLADVRLFEEIYRIYLQQRGSLDGIDHTNVRGK
jgi:predicted dehydrogenase